MPVYDYRCTECEHTFEIKQSIHDDTLTECPSCEGALSKVFSSIGMSFNGSGFYRNDHGATWKSQVGTSEA